MDYKNKYGSLTLELAGPYQAVSSIHSKDVDPQLLFSIDEAEKIALITGNVDIQLCFCSADRSKAFVIHHQSGSVAAVCKLVNLDFDKGVNATSVLARPDSYRRLYGSY